MPVQERGTRPHRPTNYQLHADVTVDRAASKVTAALTNAGRVGASLSVYPDAILPFVPTPFTVLPSAPGSYVWDATLTAGKYAFSVYGPDGFLTSFAGQVVPAGQDGYYDVAITATSAGGFRRRYAGRIA
jgi:phospholipase C